MRNEVILNIKFYRYLTRGAVWDWQLRFPTGLARLLLSILSLRTEHHDWGYHDEISQVLRMTKIVTILFQCFHVRVHLKRVTHTYMILVRLPP